MSAMSDIHRLERAADASIALRVALSVEIERLTDLLEMSDLTRKADEKELGRLLALNEKLTNENGRLREVLKKIAKPALGGEQQQWMAREALSPSAKGGGE